MIDDGNVLLSNFANELLQVIRLCKSGASLQSVVIGSMWSPLIRNLAMECAPDGTLVMTCAIEAVLKAGTEMVITQS